jgi:uncharacterized membrane protein
MHVYVDEEAASSVVSRSRLEFLVDGIFGIAITLLVLDLHVPRIADRHSSTERFAEIVRDFPTLGSYLQWCRHDSFIHGKYLSIRPSIRCP